jgi:hypothetical protein
MAEKPIRRTRARVTERERRRAQRERNERLKWQIPLATGILLLVLGVAYFIFTTSPQLSQASNKGVNGPHFQADTEKLNLGDESLGKTVKASFNVKNSGDNVLTLTTPQTASVLEGC